MGAQSSAQRDGKSQEDASASAASDAELSAEVKVLHEGGCVLDSKPLETNGQISSMTSLNGNSEDNTFAEVGQPDGVSVAQKEEVPENMNTITDEVTPQVNGEKVEKESPDVNDISALEAKATDEKPDEAGEVGFKKIFTIVGLKFTLKKDKSEEVDPVKLLTVKDKEEEVSEMDESAKDKEVISAEDNGANDKKESETETETTTDEPEGAKEAKKAETTDGQAEDDAAEASNEGVKEEGAEKESETPPPREPGLSPFRKLFFVGLFSNLRKKASIKKIKEEEEKEAALKDDTAKTEESAAEEKEKKDVAEQETKEEKDGTETTKEENVVNKPKTEEKAVAEVQTKGENKVTEQKTKEEPESKSETKEDTPTTPKEAKSDATSELTADALSPTETTTDESKQDDAKAEAAAKADKVPVEETSEAELVSSQEKTKPHGSPLKKLFTGTGLKKLSTKRQKGKKDSESKSTESSEHGAEQLQSSTESEEPPKAESGPSSPEASGEHAVALEGNQNDTRQEAEGEVASDGERKKDGVIASFKKLVSPKKHVKRSSDSEDEGTGDKPAKSDTLSSSESAPLAEKAVEEEETKEEKPSEEESKTENTEKLTSSTEETKKKMDTSVSWEALMCMGGPKKRTRKTSDSDDEETKAEDDVPAAAAPEGEGEKEVKNEAVATTSQNPESEAAPAAPAPEPPSAPLPRESPWSTLKRLVMAKNRPKVEEKPEGAADQVQPDAEAPKDESSFSLKKLFPGRRKKVVEKQLSTDQASGEEDSETPAVVPLSEYDEQVEAAQEGPAEPAAVQTKVNPEDRSPSWIAAVIEDADDKQDQLSDIPEEVENAATPKSVDTDATEEDLDDQAILFKRRETAGRRLSTAEVKPITPAPPASTSPVPQGPDSENAQEVFGSIEPQITEIPSQTCATIEDIPTELASTKTEDKLQTHIADSNTNTALEPHGRGEATAVCVGLETKEIEKVAQEEPAELTTESVVLLSNALTTEVALEEKPLPPAEAAVIEDPVMNAHIDQIETFQLEPLPEKLEHEEPDVQAATESYESEIEKVGVVSTENSEVIQPTTPKENSPKAVIVNPIAPTLETAICAQTVEVSEVTVETKEVNVEVEQLAATEENTPVEETVQAMAEEMSSAICDNKKITKIKGAEEATPSVVPTEETAVVMETVVLVAPDNGESNQEASEEVVHGNPGPEQVVVEPVVPVQKTETKVVPIVKETIEKANENVEEIKEEVHQASELETRSVAIAQAAIQDAVQKVSEEAAKPKSPSKPTGTFPTPVQATETTEKEIDLANEYLVITDTPVPVTCEKPVQKPPQPLCVAMEVNETVPIEVTHNINEQDEKKKREKEGKEGKERKKPEKKLKIAEQVIEGEETVIEEEVTEINAEAEEEQSKENQEPEVKETTGVKKENKSEPPSEKKTADAAVHMPVQVVLQAAEVFEEPPFEVETVEEFDENSSTAAENPSSQNKPSATSEEHQETAAPSQGTDAAEGQSATDKKPSAKCAEVMAQVIEVIEEAVKEIEPLSTEITAAS